MRAMDYVLRNRRNAMCGESACRPGNADGCNRKARRIKNRGANATRSDFHLLIVHGVSAAADAFERVEKFSR